MRPGDRNRAAWNTAAQKYVVESPALVEEMASAGSLLPREGELLGPLLAGHPRVVHLQSGHGQDSVDLRRLGASSVVAVDFSEVTTEAAANRGRRLGARVAFVIGDALAVPLRSGAADLVYTGKGALMWLRDLQTWAEEVARLLAPGGHLFLYEEHPAAPLWTSSVDVPSIRGDRTYFGGTRVNDTFPASAIRRFSDDPDLKAIEWQWTVADIINATIGAGLSIVRVEEYPDPFWKAADTTPAAAWGGSLPNSMSLLAKASKPLVQ